MFRSVFQGFVLALGTAAFAGGAFAQEADLSAEEIAQRLQQQQKTRGLVIVPSNSGEVATEAANEAAGTAVAAAATNYVPQSEELTIDIQIQFDFDSASIRSDQKNVLNVLCDAIQASGVGGLQIIGHTDSSGSASYNANLSRLRAEEVKRHLVNDCGMDGSQLEAIGVGEEFPANSGDPRADENRRVEFQALS